MSTTVNKILVAKETLVQRRWKSKTWKFGFLEIVDNTRFDEGLALETSDFQIFHGGNSTFINWFDKAKFSCFIVVC